MSEEEILRATPTVDLRWRRYHLLLMPRMTLFEIRELDRIAEELKRRRFN